MDEGNEEADGRARASADEPACTSVGQDIEEVLASLKEKKLFAVVYTTHSHGRPISEIKRDTLYKFAGDREPTAEDAKR